MAVGGGVERTLLAGGIVGWALPFLDSALEGRGLKEEPTLRLAISAQLNFWGGRAKIGIDVDV